MKSPCPFRFTLLFALSSLIILQFPGCMEKSADETLDLEAYKQMAVVGVHVAALGISESLKNIGDETEQIQFIRTFIEPIRFYSDNSGYFYVYNFDCQNIAHATQKDLVGQNLYDYTDSRGKYVIRELSAAAQNGSGFVEYYWVKPGEAGEKQKIGYVEPIPGSQYFIGTGVYIQE